MTEEEKRIRREVLIAELFHCGDPSDILYSLSERYRGHHATLCYKDPKNRQDVEDYGFVIRTLEDSALAICRRETFQH